MRSVTSYVLVFVKNLKLNLRLKLKYNKSITLGLNPKFEIILKLRLKFQFKLKNNTYSQVNIYLNSWSKSFILVIFNDYLSLHERSRKGLRLWLY